MEWNLFPLRSRTTFKLTLDESMNKCYCSGLYSWPRTSIPKQDTIFLGEEILEFLMVSMGETHLSLLA
jgi:hypothetical protein